MNTPTQHASPVWIWQTLTCGGGFTAYHLWRALGTQSNKPADHYGNVA